MSWGGAIYKWKYIPTFKIYESAAWNYRGAECVQWKVCEPKTKMKSLF